MNSSSPETKAARFPTFKRVFCWRNARFALIGLAGLITLFALFLTEENWRGKRAWTNYRTTMEAKGAVFDLKAIIPLPVPDEQNFAMTPLLKPVLDLYTPEERAAKHLTSHFKDTNGYARADVISIYGPERYPQHKATGLPSAAEQKYRERMPVFGKWPQGEKADLAHWQFYYRSITNFPRWPEPRTPAKDVLKALSRFDGDLTELQNAARRPHSRFNVAYTEGNPYGILLPHLAVVKKIAQVAQLRAVAELAEGKGDLALADVSLSFRLADSLKDEPILISHLVRLAILQLGWQTVAEGLQDHRWTDAQLRQLEDKLAAIDLLAECRFAMRGERAFGNGAIEWLKQDPFRLNQLGVLDIDAPVQKPVARLLFRLIPHGWFEFEQLNYNRFFDEFILAALPERAADFNANKFRERTRAFEWALSRGHEGAFKFVYAVFDHRILSGMLLPALTKAGGRAVLAQTYVDMARVALALERHRLAHGAFPEELTALAPEFMRQVPPDLITHEPFHYRRTEDGRFLLYSVGRNQVDDGGKPAYHGTQKMAIDFERGDWVWPSPAPAK